jgi:hypothetical protein
MQMPIMAKGVFIDGFIALAPFRVKRHFAGPFLRRLSRGRKGASFRSQPARLPEHDLFGKPAATFPDHALRFYSTWNETASNRLQKRTKKPSFSPIR